MEEDIKKLEKKVEKQSFAMELLEMAKEQNKQLERANKRLIGVIVFILILFAASIGGFLYYINTTGYEEDIDYKYAETDDGGNACAGDYCNNGEINYGESSSN